MLNQAIGELLPAAAAVALSPIPIVAIVLVLDGPMARRSGPAFALGWIAALMVASVLVLVIASAGSYPGSEAATGINWLMAGIGLLFLAKAAQLWRKRPKPGETPDMPAWMASISTVPPTKAVILGAALAGANPKNLALILAASAAIANAELDRPDSAIAILTFVAIGSITVVGAVVFHLVAPTTSTRPLAAIKEFMADNNATIMMVILVLLGVKLLGDALAGVWS